MAQKRTRSTRIPKRTSPFQKAVVLKHLGIISGKGITFTASVPRVKRLSRKLVQLVPQTKRRNKVREARKVAGLTQVQAAKRCGWAQAQWAQFELGTYHGPSMDTYRKAAKALKCEITDLLD